LTENKVDVKKAFVGIFFDKQSKKMYHWYINSENKLKKETVKVAYDYYTQREYFGCKDIKKDLWGRKVYHKTTDNFGELQRATEVGSCEAKVPQEIKFLHRMYEKIDLKPDLSNFNIAIIDIEIESEKEFPLPEQAKFPINLISIWTSKTNRVQTFGLRPYTGTKEINYTYCATEQELFEKFFDFYSSKLVNILSGWYCKLFDIPYMIKRCEILKIKNRFSPLGICIENQNKGGYHIDGGGYFIGGVSTLDYIDLYKNFVYDKKESYQLHSICMGEIKEGKAEFGGTINTGWKEDWNGFVEYNIQDVMLVKKLDDKMRFFDLAVNLSYQCLVPFEKVFSSVNLLTGILMRYAHQKGLVLPDVTGTKEEKFEGAYVEAKEGLYHYVVNYDVQSLYPTLIRAFNISPEKLVMNPSETQKKDLISTPLTGVYYKKEKGLLPDVIEDFFNKRLRFIDKNKVCIGLDQKLSDEEISKRFKVDIEKISELKTEIVSENGDAIYYKRQEQIIKIFMNSLYGVLGNPYFCMFNLTNAKTITGCGQDVIKYLTSGVDSWFKENWHKKYQIFFPEYNKGEIKPIKKDMICLIDTDSGHVSLEELITNMGLTFKTNQEFLDFVLKLDEKFFKPFFKRKLEIYSKKYGCKDLINFQKEKIILKKIIMAKKKYCDYTLDKKGERFDPPKLGVTGIEIIKSDTCRFGRKYLRQILQLIVETEDKKKVLEFINSIKDEFFNNTSIEDIAVPKGINDYDKYANGNVEDTLQFKLHCPIYTRAGICYNNLVRKYDLPYPLIANKSKLRYVYVSEENEIRQNVIGFMETYPDKFKEIFKVDMNTQWEKAIENICGRFFKVLKWGNVWDVETDWSILD